MKNAVLLIPRLLGKMFTTKIGMIVGFVLILVVLLSSGAFIVREKPELLGLSKGAELVQAEVDSLISEVGKLIDLPSDEKPTVATVTEADKIKEQSFFRNAKNGDKVLVYTNARKAILYRPGDKRIVEVGAVNLQQQPEVAGSTTFKVALLNGAGVSGLAQTVETDAKEEVEGLEVVSRANAVKSDYKDTLVIDLLGNRGGDADKLASAIGAEIGELPEGETKPEGVDFLILIGKDRVQTGPTPTPEP